MLALQKQLSGDTKFKTLTVNNIIESMFELLRFPP